MRHLAETPLVFGPWSQLFERLTKGEHAAQTLALRGRTLQVPAAGNSVARFTFDQLCGRPLGAEDYLGIASAFHTVVVEEVARRGLNLLGRRRAHGARCCGAATTAIHSDH